MYWNITVDITFANPYYLMLLIYKYFSRLCCIDFLLHCCIY